MFIAINARLIIMIYVAPREEINTQDHQRWIALRIK